MEPYWKTFPTIMPIGSIVIMFAQSSFAGQKQLVPSFVLRFFQAQEDRKKSFLTQGKAEWNAFSEDTAKLLNLWNRKSIQKFAAMNNNELNCFILISQGSCPPLLDTVPVPVRGFQVLCHRTTMLKGSSGIRHNWQPRERIREGRFSKGTCHQQSWVLILQQLICCRKNYQISNKHCLLFQTDKFYTVI